MYLPGIGAGIVGAVEPGGLKGRSGSAATVKTQSVCIIIIVVRKLGVLFSPKFKDKKLSSNSLYKKLC